MRTPGFIIEQQHKARAEKLKRKLLVAFIRENEGRDLFFKSDSGSIYFSEQEIDEILYAINCVYAKERVRTKSWKYLDRFFYKYDPKHFENDFSRENIPYLSRKASLQTFELFEIYKSRIASA